MDSSPFFILIIVLGVISQSFCCNPNQKSASSASPTNRPSLYEKLKQSAKAQVQVQANSQKNQGAPTTSQTLSDNKAPTKDSNEFYSSQFESQFSKGFDATKLKDLNGQQFIDHMNTFISKSPTGATSAGFTGPAPVTYGVGSGKTTSNIQSGFNAGKYPEDEDYNKNHKGRAIKNENNRQKHKHHDDNHDNNGYFAGPPTFIIPTPSIPEEHEKGFSFIPKPEVPHQHFHDNNNYPDVNIKSIAGQLDFHKDSNFVNNPEDYQNGNTLDYNSNNGNENENGQQYTDEYNGPHGKVNFNYNVNSAPFPHFQSQDGPSTNGFYNVDDPSGSWRNVAYNAGPTGFYANTNQAIQHGQGVSYGNFKTFEAGQNFGF